MKDAQKHATARRILKKTKIYLFAEMSAAVLTVPLAGFSRDAYSLAVSSDTWAQIESRGCCASAHDSSIGVDLFDVDFSNNGMNEFLSRRSNLSI